MLQLARKSDWDAVNSLALQIHEMHVAWRPDIYESASCLYSEERFDASIRNRELYVAKIDDQVVGYALLPMRSVEQDGLIKRKVMLINEICVDKSCRNQGIGRAMMADIRALAKAFRCTNIQLSVYPQNDEAVAFYQKCGFTIQTITMSTNLS